MAKLTREAKLRERRVEKNARKLIRKTAQADPDAQPYDPFAPYDPPGGLDVDPLTAAEHDPAASEDGDSAADPQDTVDAHETGAAL